MSQAGNGSQRSPTSLYTNRIKNK